MAYYRLLVFAGPNGSGKSSATGEIPVIGNYVNADKIQEELGCDALKAAQIAAQTRQYCIENHMSFTMETVLSSPYSFQVLEEAHREGYEIIMIYVLTNDPQINRRRVAERIKAGGNYVDDEKIEPRYWRSLKLLPEAIALCQRVLIYDNSADRASGKGPELIWSKDGGKMKISPSEFWSYDKIVKLIRGEDWKDNN